MKGSPRFRSLRGMPDISPDDCEKMRYLEEKAREVLGRFGFREIRTPLLEETEVFTRSIGRDTDIVEKEIYTFLDRGGKSVSLRPEGTASILRAYIEHGWYNSGDVSKLFYAGPMFRGERPQKGRLRQFHQIGVEVIGASGPYVDAELIVSLNILLKELGVETPVVLLNTLGCSRDRLAYSKVLRAYLDEHSRDLCEDCVRRASSNPLRVMDCKRKGCKAALKGAPSVFDHLCGKCKEDYNTLKAILKDQRVEFEERKGLVRGLDYYTGIVFEVTHSCLGSQDAIAAGGRYDDLSGQLGGPDTPATGYALGVERLLMVLGDKVSGRQNGCAMVIPLGEGQKEDAFRISCALWNKGVACEMDNSGRSFKGQMRRAHKDGRKYVVLIGEEEQKKGKVLLKDMELGEQREMSQEELAEELRGLC